MNITKNVRKPNNVITRYQNIYIIDDYIIFTRYNLKNKKQFLLWIYFIFYCSKILHLYNNKKK